MRPDDRSEALPEEHSAERGGENDTAGADAILAESEERVRGAVEGDAPADGADEHRRSEDTA